MSRAKQNFFIFYLPAPGTPDPERPLIYDHMLGGSWVMQNGEWNLGGEPRTSTHRLFRLAN